MTQFRQRDRTCLECGATFVAEHPKQQICSDECRVKRCQKKANEATKRFRERLRKVRQPRPLLPCVKCGQMFQPMSDIHVYCSLRCRRRAGDELVLLRTPKPTRECFFCKKEFHPGRGQRYCDTCRGNGTTIPPKDIPKWEKKRQREADKKAIADYMARAHDKKAIEERINPATKRRHIANLVDYLGRWR